MSLAGDGEYESHPFQVWNNEKCVRSYGFRLFSCLLPMQWSGAVVLVLERVPGRLGFEQFAARASGEDDEAVDRLRDLVRKLMILEFHNTSFSRV